MHAPTSASVKLQEQAKFLDAMSHEIAKFRERATEADPDKVVYGPKMAEKVRAMCSDWETALAELAALAPAVAEVAAARQAAAEAKRRAQAEERRRREEAARAEEERLRSERQAAREALQLALLEGADGNAADLLAVVWGESAEEIEAGLSPQLKPDAQGPRDAAILWGRAALTGTSLAPSGTTLAPPRLFPVPSGDWSGSWLRGRLPPSRPRARPALVKTG